MRCPLQRSFPILLSSLLIGSLAHGEVGLPRNIRVIVEYIEVPHELVTEVMQGEPADSGPKLHARMRELVKDGKAKVLETSILTTRSGQKATVESIMEHISPTESVYNIVYHNGATAGTDDQPEFPRILRIRPECPTAFETRNVGVTLEIEPTLGEQNKLIDLRCAPELDDLLRYETWVGHHDQWGDASVRRPTYESLRISTGLALEDGKFGFLGILTARNPDGGRDTTRKIMLFVRADVMTIGS